MLSKNEDAHRFEQTFVLSDFSLQFHYRFPALKRKALVHGRWHEKADFDIDSETTLLSRMGIRRNCRIPAICFRRKTAAAAARETEDRLAH